MNLYAIFPEVTSDVDDLCDLVAAWWSPSAPKVVPHLEGAWGRVWGRDGWHYWISRDRKVFCGWSKRLSMDKACFSLLRVTFFALLRVTVFALFYPELFFF